MFTDGLKAEREQGITIDVAYRYFATARRKFILADTPGHEQYTRNMATGASTADVAVLLVDARNGVRTQSRRHAKIARLLGINDFVLAINKMDLVDFDRTVFDGIVDDFEDLLRGANSHPIPISALHGDNVITQSDRTPWFQEKSLLEFLETVEVDRNASAKPFRFPVQLVLRPDDVFRGYAGQIASGTIRVGDAVTILPSGRTSKVKRIVTWDGDIEMAHAPMSVTLTIDDEIDISRGDMLVADSQPAALSVKPTVEARFEAEMVWMDERPLDPARVYLLKQATRVLRRRVSSGGDEDVDHVSAPRTIAVSFKPVVQRIQDGVHEWHRIESLALRDVESVPLDPRHEVFPADPVLDTLGPWIRPVGRLVSPSARQHWVS